jgi:hypothetical protein
MIASKRVITLQGMSADASGGEHNGVLKHKVIMWHVDTNLDRINVSYAEEVANQAASSRPANQEWHTASKLKDAKDLSPQHCTQVKNFRKKHAQPLRICVWRTQGL